MVTRICKILRQLSSVEDHRLSSSLICDSEDQKSTQRLEMQLKKQKKQQQKKKEKKKKPRHVHGTCGNHHSPTHPLRSIFHSR